MSGTSDFPSRCSPVIDERDRVFCQRMMPFIEQGESAVFLGAPHLHGVNQMLIADGYRVQQVQEIDE
jgi:pheromone shutdown protein TraB